MTQAAGPAPGGHVVLLGDSVLDNGAYVPGEPDVVRQLRGELGAAWSSTLLAVDGDVVGGVERQLQGLPLDATHLVVSAGGNDALGSADLLWADARSVAAAVDLLAGAQEQLAQRYDAMLTVLLGTGLPTAVCTIYDTRLTEPSHRVVRTALALFNDVITRSAAARGVAVLDLRVVCAEDADFANPIEPSAHGGRKIARTIAAWLEPGRPATRSTVVV
ncbi:SGNH/GDSL hydrolase family protein [Cellulomonas sp. NS3]|uniref:SGNH/GDSL hydrolase family protein n=1 Tax=Cellulomonas sp. NS3 TaxID=2973977 RepID=UPI002161118E|nr:SGNH/GDSL hydrolase family protein [Cellulomonas sp. NS3]